jgi:nucleoid-associated protein
MNIKKIVIHTLEKKQGGNAKLKKASKELALTKVHQDFMDEVKTVYYKKSNPIYGVFNSEKTSYPYQVFLHQYLKGDLTFYDFTLKAIIHFETVINESSQATGGYVLFCHFDTTEDFVAVIMLNDKNSYIIDHNQDIKPNARLDIETLDVANFTNCSRWNAAEDSYLSFTKGKKEVSNYFKKFIGCTDVTSAKEASANLLRALTDYFTANGISEKDAETTKASIFSYCEQRIKTKEDINLSFISSLVNHDEPEKFKEFASAEEYHISHAFKGHRETLRSLKYYSYRSKELTLIFDSQLINKKRIVYNQERNQLLIKEIPDDLRLQLTGQIALDVANE